MAFDFALTYHFVADAPMPQKFGFLMQGALEDMGFKLGSWQGGLAIKKQGIWGRLNFSNNLPQMQVLRIRGRRCKMLKKLDLLGAINAVLRVKEQFMNLQDRIIPVSDLDYILRFFGENIKVCKADGGLVFDDGENWIFTADLAQEIGYPFPLFGYSDKQLWERFKRLINILEDYEDLIIEAKSGVLYFESFSKPFEGAFRFPIQDGTYNLVHGFLIRVFDEPEGYPFTKHFEPDFIMIGRNYVGNFKLQPKDSFPFLNHLVLKF